MPGLVPAIHVFLSLRDPKTWMAGTRPGHDENRERRASGPLPRAISHGMIRTIGKQQGIRMRKLLLAVVFGTVIAEAHPSPPAAAAISTPSWRACRRRRRRPGFRLASTSAALGGVQQDMAVLDFDRRQRGTFQKSSERYVPTRVGPGRINAAAPMLAATPRCCRGSRRGSACPGNPGGDLGLETDFGKGDMGEPPVFRVLATMAHDCRCTELFEGELVVALKSREAPRSAPSDMIGADAAVGQTRILPSCRSITALFSTATATSICATRCRRARSPPPTCCAPTA